MIALTFSTFAVIGGWCAFFALMDVIADEIAAQHGERRRQRFFARMRGFSHQR